MKGITFSEIKELKQGLAALGVDDWREVLDNAGNTDFEVDYCRFISDEYIDGIMQEELADDTYILGCFMPSFLSRILGCPAEVIEAMQEKEAYEALGDWIIRAGKVEELQEEYVRADGYGHHFGHYDGEEHSITICGTDYYVFKR